MPSRNSEPIPIQSEWLLADRLVTTTARNAAASPLHVQNDQRTRSVPTADVVQLRLHRYASGRRAAAGRTL